MRATWSIKRTASLELTASTVKKKKVLNNYDLFIFYNQELKTGTEVRQPARPGHSNNILSFRFFNDTGSE